MKGEKGCSAKSSASLLKKGDPVVVVAGGTKKKREMKGKTGKIVRFVGKNRERVVVEGVNILWRHTRAAGPGKPHGKLRKEIGIHVSNVMYFVEKIGKGVKLKTSFLNDGKKIRGYMDPETEKFVQI